jgi:hypothetical protein
VAWVRTGRFSSAGRGWGINSSTPDGSDGHGAGPDVKPELADVARLARRAVRGLVGVARGGEQSGLSRMLADHLGADTAGLPVVEESWPPYDAVNVQAGLDAWLEAPGRRSALVGLTNYQHQVFGLAELLTRVTGPHRGLMAQPGNVARVNLPSGPDGQVRACVECGLYLVHEESRQSAVLLRGAAPHVGQQRVTVQIVSTDADFAAVAAAELRNLALEHNVFRGQVLSFGGDVFGHGQAILQFHLRPAMDTRQLILAPEVLAQIQRQVVVVARHKGRLLAAGQHLKRGLLLFGPPGVGKTHTVRYLTASLPDTTVIELTGGSLNLIGEACSVARSLQPSMIVVEDVDLIAESRGMHPGQHPLLFQLLNEMDGLAEDSDVIFVLTTNRADLLEPALAARPGRVDQAVELTLPDRSAREQLFHLYRGDLELDDSRLDEVLARTDGVTASFIKELLRRSALVAAEHSGDSHAPLRVSATDLDAALNELLETRNAMTRVLLGGARQDTAR